MSKCLNFKVVFLALLLSSSAGAQTLTEAMRAAVTNNDALRAARQNRVVQEYRRKSVRGAFLPQVRVEANVLYWDDENTAQMDLSAVNAKFQALSKFLPPNAQQALKDSGDMGAMGLQVRDQLTSKVSVTVLQPLLQLYGVTYAHKAAANAERAASYDYMAAKRKLELDVVQTYCGILAAPQMRDSLEAGIEQAEAYERQVKAFLEAGRVERNALMKVQVQVAELNKAMFTVEKNLDLLKARLNLLMGRPQDGPVNVRPLNEAQGLAENSTSDADLKTRPEILALRYRLDAARAKKHTAISALLPKLNLIFNYEHNEGMGKMMPPDQYFVGLSLSWTAWDWGGAYYKLEEARATAAGLSMKAQSLKRAMALELKAKELELKAARQKLGVAKVQAELASENLRVETKRYQAGKTTTAELLRAQTEALRARNEWIALRIDVFQKLQALRVARGQDLLGSVQK